MILNHFSFHLRIVHIQIPDLSKRFRPGRPQIFLLLRMNYWSHKATVENRQLFTQCHSFIHIRLLDRMRERNMHKYT